jgi:SpoVK/Ycf46/Vps4 family AAA+-type ATPase
VCEDDYYFKNIDKLLEEYELEEILVLPTYETISKVITRKRFGVLSFDYPEDNWLYYFVLKVLPNRNGVLTSQEVSLEITKNESVANKLGLNIIESKRSFKNLGGAFVLKEWAKRVEIMKSRKLPLKPVFFLGMPGVGKSFFISCYAGEIGVPMIDLNIPLILESDNPLRKLHRIFEFFSDTKIPCVFRIDEIAKTLKNPIVIQQLLTILNDINTSDGYYLNGVIIATENNITNLVKTEPQFFRHGRWNDKFFANFPTENEAMDIYKLFSDEYGLKFSANDLEDLYLYSEDKYKVPNLQELKSVYVPVEIEYLMQRLSMYSEDELQSKDKKDIFEKEIDIVKPQQLTASVGISKLLGEAETYGFQEI